MHKLLVLLCWLCWMPYISDAQLISTKDTSTQVLIVSTNHYGSDFFNEKDLRQVMEAFSPDIICIESDKAFQKVTGIKTLKRLGLVRTSIEHLAVQSYLKKKASLVILPYDTVFDRSNYLKLYQQNQPAIQQQLRELMLSHQLTAQEEADYKAYRQFNDRYLGIALNTSLERLNSPDLQDSTRKLHSLDRSIVAALVNKYITDQQLRDWFFYDQQFWDARNRYMGESLTRIITQHPQKKVMVFCGHFHHFFLQQAILPLVSAGKIQLLAIHSL